MNRDRWHVEYDRAFGGWIIALPDGGLVARFENEDEARLAADAVNALAVPRRASWEAEARA